MAEVVNLQGLGESTDAADFDVDDAAGIGLNRESGSCVR